jgi:hypothetical protein
MVAVHLITAAAQAETAKQAILKRLREAGATSARMPGSLEIENDDAQAALTALLDKGEVREARPGLYYLGEAKTKEAKPGNGFVALLAILIATSFTASLVTLAMAAG